MTNFQTKKDQLEALCKGLKPIQVDAILRKATEIYDQGKTDQLLGRVEESVEPARGFANDLLKTFNNIS